MQDTGKGIDENNFDAVGTSDQGVVFIREFNPRSEPHKDDHLILMKKSRWGLMKSKKLLGLDILISRGSVRT